ncbi:MAG: phosphoenolpyruvate synthase/pyruvate phosphate dikinase [Desulfosarcina sp.]|nr:phosphoenolpyruvate synthase/pyruvate phosphate dikinase [Desulfobacterales bacterium]
MTLNRAKGQDPSEFYSNFKTYHELMSRKVREILLVSSPYDAFIMEEDGSLAARIINEYSGLNLSQPPRVTRTASAEEAVALLERKSFDLVLTMPYLEEMDACKLGRRIKRRRPDLPVILLAHSMRSIAPLPEDGHCEGIDKVFIWSGNSDLLMALVKNVEDRLNVEDDTRRAQVRVLILVEDSPPYYSSFLPLIYKEIVRQTQVVLGRGLNEEHRLLKMRARPKILHARSYEEALAFYRQYRSSVFGVIADTSLVREGRLDAEAGFLLLGRFHEELADLPLLLLSSDPANRERAEQIPAVFVDKNSPDLLNAIHTFFLTHLGFGDFIMRLPDGTEVARASDLRTLEHAVAEIPEASLCYHAARNHFSNWLMGRSEIGLASAFRAVSAEEFCDPDEMRRYIISSIHALRIWRQKGVVAQFNAATFDADVMDFVRIGRGSMGGKARGLAYMSTLLHQATWLHEKYPGVTIRIPKALVLATELFEAFIQENNLDRLARGSMDDAQIARCFQEAELPASLQRDLAAYLAQVRYPLAIRSSSLLEDAQHQPYAGLYDTFMIPNSHPDTEVRLRRLMAAVKRVYASTFYAGPREFSRAGTGQPHEDAMAVIVQEVAGTRQGNFFYPAISGVAQSHNYYPVGKMEPEEGIAQVALGMGKTVVDGERALRFAPRYPDLMPYFSTVDDILRHAQQTFYALEIKDRPEAPRFDVHANLVKRDLSEAEEEMPVRQLAGTYIVDEHRIRDSGFLQGPKVLTFAAVLKYDLFPLPGMLDDILQLGRRGMGGAIEIEFAVNLGAAPAGPGEFFLLQMRPMMLADNRREVSISPLEVDAALCYSSHSLGNGESRSIRDVVYVKPEDFDASQTARMAEDIGRINATLTKAGRPYLLVGPGRWGSADRWLGIPVKWHQISGVHAIVELRNDQLNAEPSQGSHFFQNITSMGILYLTVAENDGDRFDWGRLKGLDIIEETTFIRHVRLPRPLVLKIDGRQSQGAVIMT